LFVGGGDLAYRAASKGSAIVCFFGGWFV
jgi:hypothetical protein